MLKLRDVARIHGRFACRNTIRLVEWGKENIIDLFGNYIISWLMMPQISSALNSNRFLRLR